MLAVSPCLAQDGSSALDKQVQSDKQTLSDERQKLDDYQKQAKWYDQFAQQRLTNANAERAEVEKRLKEISDAQSASSKKNPKSPVAMEIKALQGWLNDEAAKRKQIEQTRERWRSAVEAETAKIQQTKYEKDVDTASLQHQKDIDKANAERKAENPKKPPLQVQQNTVLMPGWEQGTGTIPIIEQAENGEQGAKGK
jgi:hypothetical protein